MEKSRPIERVERRLDHLTNDVAELKADVSSLKSDVSGLKSDVSALKADVSGLKADVSGLKSDVSGLKSDVADLKTGLATVSERVDGLRVLYEHHDSRFDQVFEVLWDHGRKLAELAKQRDDLRELKDFMKLVADNHEIRISALEKRD